MSPKLARSLAHMRQLAIAADIPASIKAHYLVAVLLPRLAAEIGVANVSAELANLMTRGLALHTGVCVICHQRSAADRDDCCPRCQAEVDQMAAEMDAFDDGGEE